MRVLEHHTQAEPHDDWGNKEHESEVEVEAIEGDLEQLNQVEVFWSRSSKGTTCHYSYS